MPTSKPKPRLSATPPSKASRKGSSRLAKPSSRDEDPTDGRRARGDRTRAIVLEAALAIASVQGLDGVTIGPVAAAADVSKGHLALLFGNREALQLATLQAAVDLYSSRALEPALRAGTARERLRRLCEGFFEYVEARVMPGGCLVTAVSSEFRTIEGPVRDAVIALRRRIQVDLGDAVKAALAEAGVKRKVEIDGVVHEILAWRAAANIALFLDDAAGFDHARRATGDLLARLTAGRA
jgi:AcrR family transcriptional regulator